ncbi:hypothetical protein ABW21_db0202935 [Orbilia brochopaga]|nr:hypothetical protein ABW21_db0202935 [Drechslerella brochopaga]
MSLLRIATILSAVVAVVAPPPPDPTGTAGGNTNVGGIFQPPNTNIIPATADQIRNANPLLGNLKSLTPEASSNNSPSESREMSGSNISGLSLLGGTPNSQNNTPRSIRKQARYLSPQDRQSGKSPFRSEKNALVQWKDLLEIQETDGKWAIPKLPVFRGGGMPRSYLNTPRINAPTNNPLVFDDRFGPSRSRYSSTVPVGLQSDDGDVEDDYESFGDLELSSLPGTNDLRTNIGPVTSPRLQEYLKSRPPVMYYNLATEGQGESVNTARLQYAESLNTQNTQPQ